MKDFPYEVESLQADMQNWCYAPSQEQIARLDDVPRYLRLLEKLRYETRRLMRGHVNHGEMVREALADLEAFENEMEAKHADSGVKFSNLPVLEPPPESEEEASNVVPIKEGIRPEWAGGM